jgi:four helix bundle protein
LTRNWPAEERFRLCDQLIRSSRSVTANIAEGYGRFYERDNVRFCRIARGSLYETQDHLITANDEGYLSDET